MTSRSEINFEEILRTKGIDSVYLEDYFLKLGSDACRRLQSILMEGDDFYWNLMDYHGLRHNDSAFYKSNSSILLYKFLGRII